jgi:hypothetical protein
LLFRNEAHPDVKKKRVKKEKEKMRKKKHEEVVIGV